MGQASIFVSHSHKDEDFTQRLVDDLHQAGAEVWVDVVGLTHGNFMQRIDEALAQCEWMVLVLTPNAIASQYVKSEVYSALMRVNQGYMRGVIPVLASPCVPGTIPAQWDVLHRCDATSDYGAALAGVLHAVGLQAVTPSPIPPTTPQLAPAPTLTYAVETDITDERFPPRLAQLGFERRVINDIEVIIPPICDVPGGQFLWGEPREVVGWFAQENSLSLPAFQIGRFPVTVAEYACFVRAGQREPQPNSRGRFDMDWRTQLQQLDHPVVCVSWDDARSYAGWLTYVTGQPWRLLHELEWEKAARGTDWRIYPWGNGFEQWRCNTWGSDVNATNPVGLYPAGASPCGALDMSGNVWEWTLSLFESYPYQPTDYLDVAHEDSPRVGRGGCWLSGADSARSYSRISLSPHTGSLDWGFRLARAVSS